MFTCVFQWDLAWATNRRAHIAIAIAQITSKNSMKTITASIDHWNALIQYQCQVFICISFKIALIPAYENEENIRRCQTKLSKRIFISSFLCQKRVRSKSFSIFISLFTPLWICRRIVISSQIFDLGACNLYFTAENSMSTISMLTKLRVTESVLLN